MSQQKPKILVVDDFETVRLMFDKCLRELGVERIVQAEDGQQALVTLKNAINDNDPFDLIFADWNMPNMSGYEFLLEVRKVANLKHIPFVMVTSNSDEGSVVDAIRAGVSEYMVKPFDTKSLSRTMERLIGRFNKTAAS